MQYIYTLYKSEKSDLYTLIKDDLRIFTHHMSIDSLLLRRKFSAPPVVRPMACNQILGGFDAAMLIDVDTPSRQMNIQPSSIHPKKRNMEHNHGGLEDHFPF